MGTTASIMEDGTMYHHIIALHLDEDSKSKAVPLTTEGWLFSFIPPLGPLVNPRKSHIRTCSNSFICENIFCYVIPGHGGNGLFLLYELKI